MENEELWSTVIGQPQAVSYLQAAVESPVHAYLFIGPEGDFSPDEIEAALAVGVQAISLGKQRFRTETAGLLGCHALILNHQKN